MFNAAAELGAQGRQLHDAGSGDTCYSAATPSAREGLNRIAGAPAMALYTEIKQRLTGFASRVCAPRRSPIRSPSVRFWYLFLSA